MATQRRFTDYPNEIEKKKEFQGAGADYRRLSDDLYKGCEERRENKDRRPEDGRREAGDWKIKQPVAPRH